MRKFTLYLVIATVALTTMGAGCPNKQPQPPEPTDNPVMEYSHVPDRDNGQLVARLTGVQNPAGYQAFFVFGRPGNWTRAPFDLLAPNGTINTDLSVFTAFKAASAGMLVFGPTSVEMPTGSWTSQPVIDGMEADVFVFSPISSFAGAVEVTTSYYTDPDGVAEITVHGDSTGLAVGVYTLRQGNWTLMNNCNPAELDAEGKALVDITPDSDSNSRFARKVAAVLVASGTDLPCELSVDGGAKSLTTEDDVFASLEKALDVTIVNRVPLLGVTRVPSVEDAVGRWEFVVVAPTPSQYQIVLLTHGVDGWTMRPNDLPIGVLADGTAFAQIGDNNEDVVWVLLYPHDFAVPSGSPFAEFDQSGAVGQLWIPRAAVVDTVAPSITLLGDDPMTIEVGGEYIESGAEATDNVDGDVSDRITILGEVDATTLGTYPVTYRVTDAAGNIATATRTVEVVDTTDPQITLNGSNPIQVSVDGEYVEEGATASDNYDGDISGDIVISGEVDTSTAGTYIVTYTVADSSGNSASTTRTVNVVVGEVDNTPPVVTPLGDNPMTIQVGGAYTELGATATDDTDGDITADIVISGEVNTAVLGSYTITYMVSDSAGNPGSATRTVEVVDTTAPVMTEVSDFSMPQHSMTEITLAATDNYDAVGELVWTYGGHDDTLVDVSLDGNVLTITSKNVAGNTVLSLAVTDSSNNSAGQDITIAVDDCGSPIAMIVGEPGSVEDQPEKVFGVFCGGDPASWNVVVMVEDIIEEETPDGTIYHSYWWAKPGYGDDAYTDIAVDGTWSASVTPNHVNWSRIRSYALPIGVEIPVMCGETSGCKDDPGIPQQYQFHEIVNPDNMAKCLTIQAQGAGNQIWQSVPGNDPLVAQQFQRCNLVDGYVFGTVAAEGQVFSHWQGDTYLIGNDYGEGGIEVNLEGVTRPVYLTAVFVNE